MANENRLVRGQYYKLEAGDGGSPEVFTLISCLNKKELSTDTNVIDATSDCGPDFEPGFPKSSFSLAGFVDYATATNGNYSGPTLFNLQKGATKFNFVIEPVDAPAEGDQKFEGYGFIANYKQGFDTGAMVTFDCTLQVKGDITQSLWNGTEWIAQ